MGPDEASACEHKYLIAQAAANYPAVLSDTLDIEHVCIPSFLCYREGREAWSSNQACPQIPDRDCVALLFSILRRKACKN